MKYLRIGTSYYKKVQEPLLSGDTIDKIVRWQGQLIQLDHGKDVLRSTPKYDGFCIIPSHDNYKKVHGQFYNKYEALNHEPIKGDYSNTKLFLKHIFEEHYFLALDYFTILWRYPNQTLPVLALVSSERNTGKSTFLNWLKLIFGKNMTINSSDDFDSRFNSDWSDKLIIAIDEVKLNTKQHSEKLKQLATAKSIKSEAKGKDKVEIPFFGKIILNSNDETSFITTDSQEIRYWVRKVNTISKSKYQIKPNSTDGTYSIHTHGHPDLLELLKNEVEHFIYFIKNRDIAHPKSTRMWFTREQIHTTALDKLVKGSRSSISDEIHCMIEDLFSKLAVEQLNYTASDMVELLKLYNYNTSSAKVTFVLKQELKLQSKNSSYKYQYPQSRGNTHIPNTENRKGRFYTFLKADYLVDELTNPSILDHTDDSLAS